MNELDHMLNGSGSRRHHQGIIRQAQQEKFARDVKTAQAKDKPVTRVRAVLIVAINLLMK